MTDPMQADTTGAGDALRERCAKAGYEAVHEECGCKWEDASPTVSGWFRTETDAILAEIEAAGFRVVPVSVLERLVRIADWTGKTPAIAPDVCRPMVMPEDLEVLERG